MSVCAQTEEDSASEETGAPGRDIYETKAASKVVRVLTVCAYLLSVSLAAILLSVYYVCVWKSPADPETQGHLSAQRADYNDYQHAEDNATLYNYDGRGNNAVNDTSPEPTASLGEFDVGNETAATEASDAPPTEPAEPTAPRASAEALAPLLPAAAAATPPDFDDAPTNNTSNVT